MIPLKNQKDFTMDLYIGTYRSFQNLYWSRKKVKNIKQKLKKG